MRIQGNGRQIASNARNPLPIMTMNVNTLIAPIRPCAVFARTRIVKREAGGNLGWRSF